ncbi:hypothetical protein OIDMADRAFT_39687 [Oidiodendron maius Zn]|uniref:BCS1 N-terminal domain-containing protein n=1 Tax=Oidiodendron maius (strain Zn) TaxID=913774 RepID=A0A0C3HJQ0_OIDMZ|nr:hypothetical protein OIDMADRAFT_39687 [Oidiodendron maius Zn]
MGQLNKGSTPYPHCSDVGLPRRLRCSLSNTNGYIRILCICRLIVFLGKYAYKFIDEFIENHFTSVVYVSYSNEAYNMLVTWVSYQLFAYKAASSLASNRSFLFWYKNHLFTFRSIQTENRFFLREEISVSCIGRSLKALKDLFSNDWKKTKAVDIRQLDTVILNNKRKMALLDDVKSFLDLQAWYSVCSIPYRRGYLLYRPPGTGKFSLSLLIAGQCDLDIYILSLSSVDDDSLGELFTELPARCVILLEDIDTNGRTDIVITTNHVDHLDAALIRPGRVDLKLELGLTNQDINTRLFLAIFRRDVPGNKGKVEEETALKQLAANFAGKVPQYEFSPAEIQSFLLGYRESPHTAVQSVEEWIVRAREEKMHMTRAVSLDGSI